MIRHKSVLLGLSAHVIDRDYHYHHHLSRRLFFPPSVETELG